MDQRRYGRGNGGSPVAAPRRPRTSGFRELSGPLPKDNTGKMETDSELQDSPGSDAPPGNTLAQALARQKRKRPGSASDPGDDSMDESGSGDHKEIEDKISEPVKSKEAASIQGGGPSKIPRRARSVLAKRLDPQHPARGNDLPAVHYASSPSAASVPSGRGPRRGRMPQKMRNSSKTKREIAAAAVSVSEQEREVAEALFGLANMAALQPPSPPASPARSASPIAKSEDAIAKTSAAITVAAAALIQASSPALSADGDDDSQPIISLKSSVPVSASASVSAATEEKRQKSAKREGPPEDGAPSASTSLPPLEATAIVPPKRKRPRARAKAESVPISKDGGALAVLGAAAANLAEDSLNQAKAETDTILAPGLDVLAASVAATKELGKVEKPVGPPIAAFKAEKKRVAAEKKAKAEAAEKLAQKKVEPAEGAEVKAGLDVSEGNVPIIAPKIKEPRKRKEKESKGPDGEKKEKKRSKGDHDVVKRSGHIGKPAKPEAEPEFDREGSYSDKSDREPIKPASQKSAKAAKREAMAASLKAEKAASEKEPPLVPSASRPPSAPQSAPAPVAPTPVNAPPSSSPVPASAAVLPGPGAPMPAWAQGSMPPMYFNQAMAAAAAAAAATWPNQLGMDGRDGGAAAAAAQAHIPSYMLPPRRPWKRCASHVYIAHYIEYQQTLMQLSNAGLFLRMPQQPPTPLPMAFGANASAPGGGSGPSVPGPSETGPGPTPSAAVKHERGPVGESGEGGPGQGPPGRSIGSAFQDTGARKPPQQPVGPSMQPVPKSQYSTPPPQSTSPPRAQQAPPPSSEPPPISTPPNPPPAASQGSGQASNPPTGPGTAQVTAQAAYAAQHLAMLQQNGYPFPFNPASLNLPPFPPFSGASGHLPGISPAAVAQYMAYLQTSLGIPPQGGLPPQLLHSHHSPNEHLPQPTGGPPTSAGLDVKPQTLARPNLNQQPMPGPRPPPHNDPPPNREQREEREQKVRPNLNSRPVRPPQQGEMREMDERKQFGERGGRPTEGPPMMSFLEQQSREQQARQQQQQQKLGGAPPPYRSLDLPPAFLQSPELLYQKQLSQLEASWKDGTYKPARPEGPPSQQPPPPQRHPSLAGNERNGPSQSSVGPGPLGLNPAAAGMVPRGHTTMIGTPGMLPPGPNMGPMPANFAEFLADAQRRSIEQQGQRRGAPEGGRYKDQQPGGPPEGSLQSYRDLYIQQWNEQEGRMQQQAHRPPSASEGGGQRSREGTTKPLPKQQSAVGKASPSLDLEGPSPGMGGPIIQPSRAGSGAQGPPSFGPPGQRSGGAQGPAQGPPPKTVLPRGKLAQSGGPGSMQQLPLSDPSGGRGQQLGMQKGYPFASSSGPGPSFGTGGLGSSSGRPIASQSFGALSQQQQPKPMSQGPGLSLGGQSAPSGSAQMSRLVDLSAPNQQRPVGPGGGGTYLQRAGSLGPMPQSQAAPQKGGEAFARQQAKNGKGSGSASFAKPSSASGGLFNQQRLPSPSHALPPGMVAQQHMGGLAMPGGDDKSWQYRNHGNPGGAEGKLGGVKKADEETKKKADRERRAARQRQKEQVEFELQYLADQQAHDQQKKQAAAAAAVQQATEQYAAFANAKKFAPGALLFAQQQGKAQPAGGMARQQGGKSGQPQGRGVATASGNMHAQGGLSGELGAGLTLGRNPPGSANPSNGVGNGSRNGTPGAARSHEMGPSVSHMQMARPISRGGNGARLPATVGLGQLPLPFPSKQGSAGVPGSRQSPPMPAHPGPERAAGEGNSPTGRQGRETGAAQHPQPMEPQLAKPDMSRQGYKAPPDSNGLQSQSEFTMLARPPASAPASAPSPSKPLNMAQAIAQTAPARTFETHLGNLAVPVKLPVRDAPERTPLMQPHPPLRDVPERTPLMPPHPPMSGPAQVPLLVRDAVQTPNKDASLHMAPPPRIVPSQERAILPSIEGEKGLPSSGG